ALLHMTVHSLAKSALFVTAGHVSQVAGTQRIERIRGLIRTQPALGWSLLIGTVAFAGLFRHLQPMVYGEPPPGQTPVRVNLLPVLAHMVLLLWLGLAMPGFLADWFKQATVLITGSWDTDELL